MTKVILLFGVSNHNRFLDKCNRDALLFRIESCGNLDPTAGISETVGRIYLLFHRATNRLERIVLMAQHPECTTPAGQRSTTYRRIVIQDLLLNLALALSFTPILSDTSFWAAFVEEARCKNILDTRTASIVAAAIDTIQQDICNFTITEATDPDCPQVLREFASSKCYGMRWIDTVLGQYAGGHTVEAVAARGFPNLKAARRNYVLLNRPKGFPSLRKAHEAAMIVNRAKGFPGMQAAQKVSLAMRRAAGFPDLEIARKIGLEVNRANGFPNLKAALEVNRASGFQNTKGALKKAWEASRLSGYKGSKEVLKRAREVLRERGNPGLQTAARNKIQKRLKRAVEELDLVRPADGQPGSRVARKCALCLSDVRDDETPLYTREGLYVVLSKQIKHETCGCSLNLSRHRMLVPKCDGVKTINWDKVRRVRKKDTRAH